MPLGGKTMGFSTQEDDATICMVQMIGGDMRREMSVGYIKAKLASLRFPIS